MVKVRLPDGRTLEYPDGVTAGDVVRSLDPDLAREAVAAQVNGEVVDLARRLVGPQVDLRPLTLRDPEGLQTARHSCAHVMAEAICTLWPQTRLVYGPPVENGFYYDIDLDRPITPDDFPQIEARMAEIVREDRPFTRYELPREEALRKLEAEGNPYKVDNAQRAEGETLSFYVTGTRDSGHWEDLCRGPHVPSTGRVGVFKIMQVAGAYWHGDASQPMLQRIYGTCWPTREELEAYLRQLEEAAQRDHRRLGPELGLFAIDPLVGTGLILWKPHGAIIRHELEQFIRQELVRRGYLPVYTPHIGRLELYRISGHFPYYRESQYPALYESETARVLNELWTAIYEAGRAGGETFPTTVRRLLDELRRIDPALHEELVSGAGAGRRLDPAPGATASNLALIRQHLQRSDGYLLKPMNCPHHIRIYASEPRSYRDLPVRLAEFGTVYRYEQSGEVGGLTRVRGMTQDDAHIFCTPEQLHAELAGCVDMARRVLDVVGLTGYRVRASLRDGGDKYVGSPENWEKAEAAILEVCRASGMDWFEARGEAAFYGPKIDFLVRDVIGREWQLGTVQCDYNLPERFDLTYIGTDNRPHRPVMVHRAPLGSLERFIGILIEHFAGAFPLWLAPVQAVVCNVSDRSLGYARQVVDELVGAGLRVQLDDGNERIGAKIRRATLMKVPYVLVVGQQEVAAGTVNVRTRDGRQVGGLTPGAFLAACAREIANRSLHSELGAESRAAPGAGKEG